MGHKNKQKHIMRVVERLAADRRFHEITLDEVAELAGVGKGTIYRYFPDKDELFFQVAVSAFDELCELLKRTVSCETSFSEKLSNACEQMSRFFDERSQLFQMMRVEADFACWHKGRIRQRWLDKRKMLVNCLADIFCEGVTEGIVRSDISPEVMAAFFLGLLRAGARDLQRVPENMKNCTLLLDVFLNGVSVSPDKVSIQKIAVTEIDSNC